MSFAKNFCREYIYLPHFTSAAFYLSQEANAGVVQPVLARLKTNEKSRNGNISNNMAGITTMSHP